MARTKTPSPHRSEPAVVSRLRRLRRRRRRQTDMARGSGAPPPHLYVRSTVHVALVLLGCCTPGLLSECPRLCECKWKSGKESVLCLNANLSAVPLALDAGTQVLDLTGNTLVTVRHDEFSKAGLLNLQKIYLSRCRLKALDRFAFRNLINLVELDLGYNALATVPSHVFDSIPELRELKLSGNPIQRLLNHAFVHVPQLVRVELSDCKIGTVEPDAFAGLQDSLEWLKLDGNRLVEVRSSTLTALRSLHGLELAGNPWNCSCALRPLREWMIRQNVPFGVPPVCKFPARLAGKPWDRLDLDEFACVPQILAPDPRTHGVEGRNVTMTCQIAGVPEPSVRWTLKNRVIANLSGVPFANGKKLYVLHLENNSSNLTILTADVQDAGVYVCAAENKAGRVEASVTLAVSRKPPEHTLHNKAIVAAIVVAALFVLASCLVVLCVCSVRRRQNTNRWHTGRTASGRRTDDSYEKIEMNHKQAAAAAADNGANGGAGAGGNGLAPQAAGDVAVVGPLRRNGEYRVVPCVDTDHELDEDEDVGYEDNTETPTPTNQTRDTKLWTAAASGRNISSPNNWNANLCESSLDMEDLHIPRRTKEETRDDCNKNRTSTFGTYKGGGPGGGLGAGPGAGAGPGTGPGAAAGYGLRRDKPQFEALVAAATITGSMSQSLQPHVMRKQILGERGGSLYTSAPPASDIEQPAEDPDRQFPDLLESFSSRLESAALAQAGAFKCGGSVNNLDDNFYCTLPRKKPGCSRAGARYQSFDSQSPLLPDSRYGSSGGESSASHGSSRRLSEDSYTRFPLANVNRCFSQRSNSYLNLVSTTGGGAGSASGSAGGSAGSTSGGRHCSVSFQSKAQDSTPLLDVTGLESKLDPKRDGLLSAANTYDYHAAQLERFLEEYRTLQKQLNKMKETCDNMRQQDEPKLSNSRFLDPLLHNNVVTPGSEEGNPKSILKKTVSASPSPVSGILDMASPMSLASAEGSERSSLWSTMSSSKRSGYYQT